MSTNEQFCKYIDKDKILPWLEKEIKGCEKYEDAIQELKYSKIGLETVKRMIEEGMFDWQRGSEKIIWYHINEESTI